MGSSSSSTATATSPTNIPGCWMALAGWSYRAVTVLHGLLPKMYSATGCCPKSTHNDQDYVTGRRAVARWLRYRPQTVGLQGRACLRADECHDAVARVEV